MKKIYYIVATLVIVILGMSYLYFSKLNTNTSQSDLSLDLIARNAGIVISYQNEKSVIEILKSQKLLDNIIGPEKTSSLESLRDALVTPEAKAMFLDQNISIGFYPGKTRNLEVMLGVQINPDIERSTILTRLKQSKVHLKPYSSFYQLQLPDSSNFYLALKDRVVLVGTSADEIERLLDKNMEDTDDAFITFIQKNDRLSKNSLANLYINYNQLPTLMKSVTPYFNRGELALLNRQDAFARLSYNFSKEKVFLNGETKVDNVDSYFSLFSSLKPEKADIDKILPYNTANYTLYSFGDYKAFHTLLKNWFKTKKEDKARQENINELNQKYRLKLDDIFPKYTSSQAVTFQLQNKQMLAAVKLLNGDKVEQLLLDLSDDYNGSIRILKEPDLLYYYFGAPFKKFKQPYYIVVNNYILFAPYASSLQDFQNHYQNSRLLILDKSYAQVYKQLPLTSNILFYLNNKRSQNIIINTIYPAYYDHYNAEVGLKAFESFAYQLSGDQGSFQTNILINTKQEDKVNLSTDSLDIPDL